MQDNNAEMPAPVEQPMTGSDDLTYTVHTKDGREFGPVNIDGLKDWARQRRIAAEATVAASDGTRRAASDMPELAAIIASALAAPPTTPGEMRKLPPADGISVMVPYRNPRALTAYYLGLFSLLPLVGLLLSVPAFILGIAGLRARHREPEIRGAVHAWIGVIMGGLLTLVWAGTLTVMLAGWFLA